MDPKGITPSAIFFFLQECGQEVTNVQSCQNFLMHYDHDQDGFLSYKEFLEIVLPQEN